MRYRSLRSGERQPQPIQYMDATARQHNLWQGSEARFTGEPGDLGCQRLCVSFVGHCIGLSYTDMGPSTNIGGATSSRSPRGFCVNLVENRSRLTF